MIRWINTPCTDPAGRVFTADGRIYRAVFPGQEDLVRSLIENRELAALMEEGRVARTWLSDRVVPGFGMVVEMEKAPFDVPCERFTRATLRAATLGWLEISRRLQPAGLALSDAHFGNFMLFAASEPRWIDLGSIRPQRFAGEDKPFPSFRKFWGGMLAPLLLLATQPRHSRLARLSIADRPYQGPLTTADESPLSVDAMVEDVLAGELASLKTLAASQAMDQLQDFAARLPVTSDLPASGAARRAVPEDVEALARAKPVASVICLGADACELVPAGWSGAALLVVDEEEQRLDAIAASRARAGGQLALYYEHPVNRRFLDHPPQAEVVLAIDPLERYAHPSSVAAENLSHVLGALGAKLAVVLTPSARKTPTERMLRQAYPAVTTMSAPWFGGGPVILVGSR
jgi:hypothetical protein